MSDLSEVTPKTLTDDMIEGVKFRAENQGDHETARHCRRVLNGTRTQMLYDYSVQCICDAINARDGR